jgi:Na+/H+-dicarboxylate symporter
LLQAYADKIKYKHKNGVNTIKIIVGMVERQLAMLTLIAFLGAILLGAVGVAILPSSWINTMDAYFFLPIEKMFISILQLITAPAVFFSIICCVARFTEFTEPGRVTLKIFAWYIISNILAVIIGIHVFGWIKPGEEGMFAHMVENKVLSTQASGDISIMDTIISTVPSNIVEPFLNINSMQLVFMAVLCGIAVGTIGNFSGAVKNFFSAGDVLFSKITSLIMNVVPIAVFCATFSVMIHNGFRVWISVLEMVVTVLIGMMLIMLFYVLIILCVGRMNPFIFLKKYYPELKNTFVQGSGLASIPNTIHCCKHRFGISSKIYSFSIPFGATVNLDGNCVYLTIAGLFLARLCGIDLFSANIFSLIFAIIILSVGAPITPGSALLCLFVLLTQMGVSLDITILIMGVNFFIEMLLAMANTMGDVAITLVVAKGENLVDMKKYKKI